jgi:hypothetical protein
VRQPQAARAWLVLGGERLAVHREAHGALDESRRLARGLLRAQREAAHLLGHHREAAPCFARPRRLDGGVRRQQVRLEGDVVDVSGDDGHALGRLLDVAQHFGDGAAALLRCGARRLGQGAAPAAAMSESADATCASTSPGNCRSVPAARATLTPRTSAGPRGSSRTSKSPRPSPSTEAAPQRSELRRLGPAGFHVAFHAGEDGAVRGESHRSDGLVHARQRDEPWNAVLGQLVDGPRAGARVEQHATDGDECHQPDATEGEAEAGAAGRG